MESLSWQVFFEKIKEALGNDDLFISMDEDQLTMTIWCSFDDKQQTSVTFELTYVNSIVAFPNEFASNYLQTRYGQRQRICSALLLASGSSSCRQR
jgi:hypothetical protein